MRYSRWGSMVWIFPGRERRGLKALEEQLIGLGKNGLGLFRGCFWQTV
jgi:hypothetical protein